MQERPQVFPQGRRPDLQSGGARELAGEERAEDIFDLRVLGKGNFVQKVLESIGVAERPRIRKLPLKDLVPRLKSFVTDTGNIKL